MTQKKSGVWGSLCPFEQQTPFNSHSWSPDCLEFTDALAVPSLQPGSGCVFFLYLQQIPVFKPHCWRECQT